MKFPTAISFNGSDERHGSYEQAARPDSAFAFHHQGPHRPPRREF